jgi:hypothetical protein
VGVTGPIPQRSDQTVRRNKPEVPISKITTIGPVQVPDLKIANPHPLVTDLFESMKTSGQSKFYEPSDWAHAQVTFHFLNDLLWSSRPSAMLLSTVSSMLTSLLLTEGDRRRVRIEVERNQNAPEGKVLQAADYFRQALDAQGHQAT